MIASQREKGGHAVSSGGLLRHRGRVYLLGGLVLTMTVNVPMNETLGQIFNILRTIASAIGLLLAGLALRHLTRLNQPVQNQPSGQQADEHQSNGHRAKEPA